MLSVKPSVYMVDYAVFHPPESWRISQAEIIECLRRMGNFNEESLSFMARMLERSGTGNATHWPPHTLRIIRPELGPRDEQGNLLPVTGADTSIAAAKAMTTTVMFGCMDQLIQNSGLRPKDIDFLIVNCSLFCPTPSLASMVAQRYSLRPDVRSYNLGGMGCSAGLISIDLAKQLLQNRPNSVAVVISLEDITQNLYTGSKRSMLLQNTLFRVGGAAVLLSNKPMDGFRAKYKLLYTVRVQDTSATAQSAVVQCEDEAGKKGVELSKELMNVAGKVLRDNLTILGPAVLPIREQAKVLISLAARKGVTWLNAWADRNKVAHLPFACKAGPTDGIAQAGGASSGGEGTNSGATTGASGASVSSSSSSSLRPGRYPRPDVYVPNFKLGIQHFCIHAGGRAVIDGIETSLQLEPRHTAPSRQTLLHWGNTSSSSIWYELKYAEGEDPRFPMPEGIPPSRVLAGERVLQIGFGSGFKCNSAVWLRMR